MTFIKVILVAVFIAALLLIIGKYKVWSFLKSNPAVLLYLIMLIGFCYPTGGGISSKFVSDFGDAFINMKLSKIIRIITVSLSGIIALFILVSNISKKGMNKCFSGPIGIYMLYFLSTIISAFCSKAFFLSLFKSFEIGVLILASCVVFKEENAFESSKRLISSVCWFYVFINVIIWLEFVIFGREYQYDLGGRAKYIEFMLQGVVPYIHPNSVALIGGIVSVFGISGIFHSTYISIPSKKIGLIIFLMGLLTVFFSYSRTMYVYLSITLLLILILNKKFVWLLLLMLISSSSLLYSPIQDVIKSHFVRESFADNIVKKVSQDQIKTLSGRLVLWRSIVNWDITSLLLGEGLYTATSFHGYEKGKFAISHDSGEMLGAGNAHNSLLEVLSSTGLLGAICWLFLIMSILLRIIFYYMKYNKILYMNDRSFELFVIPLFLMCLIRCLTNTTFVYLDISVFLLPAFAVYATCLRGTMSELVIR